MKKDEKEDEEEDKEEEGKIKDKKRICINPLKISLLSTSHLDCQSAGGAYNPSTELQK